MSLTPPPTLIDFQSLVKRLAQAEELYWYSVVNPLMRLLYFGSTFRVVTAGQAAHAAWPAVTSTRHGTDSTGSCGNVVGSLTSTSRCRRRSEAEWRSYIT